MRLGLAKSVRLAALLAIFLAAETAALAHGELEDTHPTSGACALCVGLATLATGNVATPHHFAVVIEAGATPGYLLQHAVQRRAARPVARGPPEAS
jgi:hypothetical protein